MLQRLLFYQFYLIASIAKQSRFLRFRYQLSLGGLLRHFAPRNERQGYDPKVTKNIMDVYFVYYKFQRVTI